MPNKQFYKQKHSYNTNTTKKWKSNKKPYPNYYKDKNIIVPTKNIVPTSNWVNGTFTMDAKTLKVKWTKS